MNKHTARRKRRRAKLQLNGGEGAARKHVRKTGRTGMIWSKHSHGKAAHYSHLMPNPPVRIEPLGGPS